jgi:hypothetical protein
MLHQVLDFFRQECKIRFKSTQDSGLKIPTFRA